jgi:hypothetical protein
MIPNKFNKETKFLSDINLNSMKLHYMTFYWKVRKGFLGYIEDSMSNDSLIGSTISNISLDLRRMFLAPVQFLPQVFFHMILRHQKYQSDPTQVTFNLTILMMTFYQKLTLRDIGTILRKNLKKIRIV